MDASMRAEEPPSPDPPVVPEMPSIVVLPFQNLSADPEQEYFSDGIVEEITTALSRFRWLFVIARNSAFTYKGRAVDVRRVGRELGVRYLLEGSVRKAANRVRITGQLIDVATAAHLWADRFDGTPEDIFDLQDDLTASVVGAISPALDQAEANREPGRLRLLSARPSGSARGERARSQGRIAAFLPGDRAGPRFRFGLWHGRIQLLPSENQWLDG
jgi:TolB-like protein